jgi:hypothetical protein
MEPFPLLVLWMSTMLGFLVVQFVFLYAFTVM